MAGRIATLFDPEGKRLYLTEDERRSFMEAASIAYRPTRTLCGALHYTGCRISEALELTPQRGDLTAEIITFRSLKKRGKVVYRAVPVPPDFLDVLNMVTVSAKREEPREKTGPFGITPARLHGDVSGR